MGDEMRVRAMERSQDGITGCTILCDVCDKLGPALFIAEPASGDIEWAKQWICCSRACAEVGAARTLCGDTAPTDHPQTRLRNAGIDPDDTWPEEQR